jgi:hypothetical protein
MRERTAGSDFRSALVFHLQVPALLSLQLQEVQSIRERLLGVLLASLWLFCNTLGFLTGLLSEVSRSAPADTSRPAGAPP